MQTADHMQHETGTAEGRTIGGAMPKREPTLNNMGAKKMLARLHIGELHEIVAVVEPPDVGLHGEHAQAAPLQPLQHCQHGGRARYIVVRVVVVLHLRNNKP